MVIARHVRGEVPAVRGCAALLTEHYRCVVAALPWKRSPSSSEWTSYRHGLLAHSATFQTEGIRFCSSLRVLNRDLDWGTSGHYTTLKKRADPAVPLFVLVPPFVGCRCSSAAQANRLARPRNSAIAHHARLFGFSPAGTSESRLGSVSRAITWAQLFWSILNPEKRAKHPSAICRPICAHRGDRGG